MTEFLAIQRQAAWSDVARRVAHEIKNPLTPIQLSAERLKRRYLPQIQDDPETFQKCVETITRQVEVLGRIVGEFSSFGRLPKPAFTAVDLGALVAQVVCLHQQAYPFIGMTVEGPETLLFTCDAQQITQVLTNLIKNAVESIQDKGRDEPLQGRITVSLAVEGSRFRLEVQDNGRGFPLKKGWRFAEPYWTTKEKGTGLGLAIVKKIVEDHGGSLSWETMQEGGALVRVILQDPEEQQEA
jgi:two-component system nitrogen regulation sensor histidine kinase NtrY